jgi:hypothetical protein
MFTPRVLPRLFQTVWNVLDCRDPGAGIRDYDLFYFDEDTSYEAEAEQDPAAEHGGALTQYPPLARGQRLGTAPAARFP